MAKIHGGQIVARALRAEGVDAIFTLTGGHIVPILDGCVQEGIRVVDVRHEQAAAHAAEAYTRLTGRLGVAAVTAGPGVTDAITGVATAWYSQTPMLLLGGRHLLRQELRGGLQEMDHPRLFGAITAWSGTCWQVERLADHVAVAARHAFAGRGAPVFLDIPMDVQFDMVEETAVSWPARYRASERSGRRPGHARSDRRCAGQESATDGLRRGRIARSRGGEPGRRGGGSPGAGIPQQPGERRPPARSPAAGQPCPVARLLGMRPGACARGRLGLPHVLRGQDRCRVPSSSRSMPTRRRSGGTGRRTSGWWPTRLVSSPSWRSAADRLRAPRRRGGPRR